MVAGDSVTILAGTYDERVKVTKSGSSGLPISYQAEGTVMMKGFTVTSDYITIIGFEITDTPDVYQDGPGIFVEGSYCLIEENYIHYATRGGILLFAQPGNEINTSHCTVRNNRLYQNSQNGIDLSGRDHIIEGNEIWDSIQYHPKWVNPPSYVDADGMRFFGSGHIIRGNYIHDIPYGLPGIDPSNGDYNDDPHIDCFQTWVDTYHELAQNIVFEQNICENLQSQALNENGHGFMLKGGANNLIIRNNIIKAYNGMNTGGSGNAHHLFIYNNLWINDLAFTQFYPAALALENAPYSIVKNNILYNQPYHTIRITSDTTGQEIDYNLAYNSDGSTPDCVRVNYTCVNPSLNDKWKIDPRFAKPETNNFHLLPNSPAIDTGIMLNSVVDDFDAFPRPIGSGFDIGAFEYQSYLINTYPPIVHENDILYITISFVTIGQPIVITSTLPTQLDYLSSSSTCPATVTYSETSRTVTLSGNPPPASNCNIQIDAQVITDQAVSVTVSATIDNGLTIPQYISKTILLNGFSLYLPLNMKSQ
jgi:hypothetical protein